MSKQQNIDLIEVFTILARQKKILLLYVITITLIGIVIAFIWPKTYKSEVSFIVTESNSINFSGGGLLGGLSNFSMGGGNVTSDQILVLLRSKEIQNKIIENFELSEIYGTEIPEALRKKVNNRTIIQDNREGGLGFNNIISISLSYEDEDPERTYNIVNYYYDLIDKKARHLNAKNVEGAYLLLESRLNRNRTDLNIAEDSLVSFQKKYGILEIEEQAKAQIEGIALLKTEIVTLEVEIGYLRTLMGEDNSKIKELEIQKKEYERKYNDMLVGIEEDGQTTFDPFYSFKEMPELFLEYLRRYRDVVVQEEIYKVLFPQFEQQKLRFQEVESGLRIIDPALLPTYKNSPKRAYIIIASFMFGIFFAFLIIIYKENVRRLEKNNKEGYIKLSEFKSALKNW